MSTKEIENSLDFIHKCRRSHERFPWKTSVEVISGENSVEGETVNISAGGIYIIYAGSVKPGDIIEVKLDIPGVENNRVRGEVRWFMPHRDNLTGCGLKFLGINNELLRALVNITINKDLREL